MASIPRRSSAPLPKKLGAILREMRMRRGLTIADLARRMKTDEPRFSRKERGLINMTYEEFERVAKELGFIVEVVIIDKAGK